MASSPLSAAVRQVVRKRSRLAGARSRVVAPKERNPDIEEPACASTSSPCSPIGALEGSRWPGGAQAMYTERYDRGMTELEKGPQGRRRGSSARASASSARHSSCSAIRASTAPAWTSSARWPGCRGERPTSTSPARTNSSPSTCAESIPTSCPECSTAPTSRPANDSSLPSRAPRPDTRHHAPVPLHRGGRRDPRPPAPRNPVRTRLQESRRRAARRNQPRSLRHQPRTARRATGAAHRWRLCPDPGS